MPICICSSSSNTWQQVIRKIKAKFAQWGVHWLNPSRHSVLIKYALSTFPVFQYSTLLAPIGIKQQIAQETWKFLWQGGKTNSKRYHLVSWHIVRAPKEHGGLGIKDIGFMKYD
jgi:hypothetical protein